MSVTARSPRCVGTHMPGSTAPPLATAAAGVVPAAPTAAGPASEEHLVTVHCPNTGPMTGLLDRWVRCGGQVGTRHVSCRHESARTCNNPRSPGGRGAVLPRHSASAPTPGGRVRAAQRRPLAPVVCSRSSAAGRKYQHTLEMIQVGSVAARRSPHVPHGSRVCPRACQPVSSWPALPARAPKRPTPCPARAARGRRRVGGRAQCARQQVRAGAAPGRPPAAAGLLGGVAAGGGVWHPRLQVGWVGMRSGM